MVAAGMEVGMGGSHGWRCNGVWLLLLTIACGSSSDGYEGTAGNRANAGASAARGNESISGASGSAGNTSREAADAGSPATPPRPMGCITDVAVGHHVYACDDIRYDVEIPPQCLETQCGLVVDVHGATMNANQQNENTNMRALGQEFGYVVVQPNLTAGFLDVSQDPLVFSMMRLVTDVFHLDEKRIHMTGFSLGGFLAWRFICKYSDILASAAPMSAAKGGNSVNVPGCAFSGAEKPAAEIPLIQLQGTMDPLISNAAGEAQRDAVVAAWEMGPGEQVAGDERYRRVRYKNANGTVFEFLQHDYSSDAPFAGGPIGGHCFPGSSAHYDPSTPQQETKFGCNPPNAFHWGSEAMQFFIAHPRR
jgi:dienelactone hydrolase